jgi:hypothetical protein
MFIGGRTRTRTVDPLIKSQLLCQLSYDFVIIPAIEILQFPATYPLNPGSHHDLA